MNRSSQGVLPDPHATFLGRALAALKQDPRLVGVAVGGSYLTRTMDEFSDLDLVVAVEPAAYEAVSEARLAIAGGIGTLLAAFTGEHVGEPRLLICLYGPPLLHVDLKFISVADASARVEDPVVLWERDARLSTALRIGEPLYPQPDLQWIEDRFWVWIHYAAAKIGRGELFEAIDFLGFLRARVLGPLALVSRHAQPAGVRKLEISAPELVAELRATIATHDRGACVTALRCAARLYRTLRAQLAGDTVSFNHAAEEAVMAYLEGIDQEA